MRTAAEAEDYKAAAVERDALNLLQLQQRRLALELDKEARVVHYEIGEALVRLEMGRVSDLVHRTTRNLLPRREALTRCMLVWHKMCLMQRVAVVGSGKNGGAAQRDSMCCRHLQVRSSGIEGTVTAA